VSVSLSKGGPRNKGAVSSSHPPPVPPSFSASEDGYLPRTPLLPRLSHFCFCLGFCLCVVVVTRRIDPDSHTACTVNCLPAPITAPVCLFVCLLCGVECYTQHPTHHTWTPEAIIRFHPPPASPIALPNLWPLVPCRPRCCKQHRRRPRTNNQGKG